MFFISLLGSFFSNIKNWVYIIAVLLIVGLFGMYSCERKARIKAENQAESDKLITEGLSDHLNDIYRDKNNKEHTITTVIGIVDNSTMKYALQALKFQLNSVHLKLNKVLLAQQTSTDITLPSSGQSLIDSIPNQKTSKTFKADTINKYFTLLETIKMDVDSSCIIKNALIQREKILINDSTSQYISLGKFKKRFLRIPFLKFNGIGVSDPEIISETIHSNPHINTIEQNIILRKSK